MKYYTLYLIGMRTHKLLFVFLYFSFHLIFSFHGKLILGIQVSYLNSHFQVSKCVTEFGFLAMTYSVIAEAMKLHSIV